MIDWLEAAALTRGITSEMFDRMECRLLPMVAPHGGRDVNARPVADTSRVEFDFLALFDREPSQDAVPRHLPSDPGTAGNMVSYDAVVSAMTGAWPYLPRRFDRIQIGEQVFTIMLDRTDGSERRAFYVNQVN